MGSREEAQRICGCRFLKCLCVCACVCGVGGHGEGASVRLDVSQICVPTKLLSWDAEEVVLAGFRSRTEAAKDASESPLSSP